MKLLGQLINSINIARKFQKKNLFFPFPIGKLCHNFLQILINEGFIKTYKIINKHKRIGVWIEFRFTEQNKNIIRNIHFLGSKTISINVSLIALWKKQRGEGLFILSTPQGLLTDFQARLKNISGQLIAVII